MQQMSSEHFIPGGIPPRAPPAESGHHPTEMCWPFPARAPRWLSWAFQAGGGGIKEGIDGRRAGRRCCGGGSAAPAPRSAPELGRQRSRAAAPELQQPPSCSSSSSSGAEHERRLRLQCCLTHFPLPHPLLASACRASSTFQGNVKLLSKHCTASQTHTHTVLVREYEAAVLCPPYSVC